MNYQVSKVLKDLYVSVKKQMDELHEYSFSAREPLLNQLKAIETVAILLNREQSPEECDANTPNQGTKAG
jgi:hypothetical protein